MKKATQIICFLFLFNAFSLNAQNALNVQITGDCSVVSGVYNYIGVLNGNNNYLLSYIDNGHTVNIYVHFNGTIWMLNSGEDITNDILFVNMNVSTSPNPPIGGWILGNCPTGTMTITEILATNQFENNKISIYPNPTSNYITIQNTENQTESLNYKIIDLTGRVLKSGSINNNEKINVEELISGNYIVQIKNENNQIVSHKLLIN